MKVRFLLVFTLLFGAASGCNRDRMQLVLESKNNENRMLEDALWELDRDYQNKCDEVEKLRNKLETLQGGSSTLVPGGSQRRQEPRDIFPDPPKLDIDSGTPGGSSAPAERSTLPESGELDDLEPPKLDLGDGNLSQASLPADQQVTQLYLDTARTGGRQRDNQPGDDALAVVFEPRNAEGQFVPLPGSVSIVLLDPQTRQPVADWEYSAEQLKLALQQAHAGHGVELVMPWPSTPPAQSRLHLMVRYWPPGGKAVQSDSPITITPQGQLAARWTPRTEQRPAPPGRRLRIADQTDTEDPGVSSSRPQVDPQHQTAPRQAQLPQWRPYR